MPDIASPLPLPRLPQSFDDPLGRKIIELHVWSVGEGLRGKEAALLFDGLCQRLVIAGVPLWRAFAGMRTLHPQWGGYAYTWWRDRTAILHCTSNMTLFRTQPAASRLGSTATLGVLKFRGLQPRRAAK